MAMCMPKYDMACMDYHKPASLPTSNWKRNWNRMDTIPSLSHQAFGNMTPAKCISLLVVDDFGVKYMTKTDANHLMTTLWEVGYKVSEDWEGTQYCGLTIAWNYDQQTFMLSMPGYIECALQCFQHTVPMHAKHSPHAWNQPQYGTKVQYATEPRYYSIPWCCQQTACSRSARNVTFLCMHHWHHHAQSHWLFGNATIETHWSHHARHRQIVKLCCLTSWCQTSLQSQWHGSVDRFWCKLPFQGKFALYMHGISLFVWQTMQTHPNCHNHMMQSLCTMPLYMLCATSWRKLSLLHLKPSSLDCFTMARRRVPFEFVSEELGHKQPPTPMKTDNTTAEGLANDTVKQKWSKAIDMHFYWIRDRVQQGQYHIYWCKAEFNCADYFTKHHSSKHHQQMRKEYLHQANTARTQNYYEPLNSDDLDEDIDPFHEVDFVPFIQVQTFDPMVVTIPSCEGVLIPG